MKDSDPPSNDDDGWGDAAANKAPPASEAAIDNEWDDPADLEKRVAALKEQQGPEDAPVDTSVPVEAAVLAGTPDLPTASPTSEESLGKEVASHQEANSRQDVGPSDVTAAEASSTHATSMAALDDAVSSPPLADLRSAAGIIDSSTAKATQKDAPKKTKTKKKSNTPTSTSQLTPRQKLFIVGGSAALVAAGVCAVLGWFNSQNYYLRCNTESISATQGRFWPWGENPLSGAAFRPIEVPRDVQCTDEHYESRVLLEQAFLRVLLAQSTALLTSGEADNVSRAESQLNQALLLSRSPERSKQRAEAVRLEGDVSYWRGAAQIQAAAALLQQSATYFGEAASKRPRHTSDANAWAEHAKFMESEIDKGPHPLRKDDAPKDKPHFQGLSEDLKPASAKSEPSVATPAEPAPDAGLPDSPPDAALPPADAALPKGGVLL